MNFVNMFRSYGYILTPKTVTLIYQDLMIRSLQSNKVTVCSLEISEPITLSVKAL